MLADVGPVELAGPGPVLADVGPVELAGPGPVLADVGPVELAGPGPVLADVGPVELAGPGPGIRLGWFLFPRREAGHRIQEFRSWPSRTAWWSVC